MIEAKNGGFLGIKHFLGERKGGWIMFGTRTNCTCVVLIRTMCSLIAAYRLHGLMEIKMKC